MKHRTSRAFRAGVGWQARCTCHRWASEWMDTAEEARALGRVHEEQPEEPDWSIVERWLTER